MSEREGREPNFRPDFRLYITKNGSWRVQMGAAMYQSTTHKAWTDKMIVSRADLSRDHWSDRCKCVQKKEGFCPERAENQDVSNEKRSE